MTRAPRTGAIVDLTVEAIGGLGDGVSHCGGTRVFLPLTVPGDRVRARLAAKRGDGFAAEVIERRADGPDRVAPPCRHFGSCGGCALQHLADDAYVAWKRGRLVEALAHRGLDETAVEPLVRTPPNSRRRVAFVGQKAYDGIRLGFRARGSRRIVDIASCPVITPALMALLPALRELLADLLATREAATVAATEVADGLDVVLGLPRVPGLAELERLAAFAEAGNLARLSWRGRETEAPEPIVQRRPVRMGFADVIVDLPPGAFLQPSAPGEAVLVGEVTSAVGEAERIVDLYAGCGTFSFALASSARVHTVEGDAAMTGALAAAVDRAGLHGRVTVETRDLDRRPLRPDELAMFAACVFDPPRAGARRQAEALAASAVETVVAVSCNPATFARDLRILVDGGYVLARVVPLDQFLWSPHVEVVAVLKKDRCP